MKKGQTEEPDYRTHKITKKKKDSSLYIDQYDY